MTAEVCGSCGSFLFTQNQDLKHYSARPDMSFRKYKSTSSTEKFWSVPTGFCSASHHVALDKSLSFSNLQLLNCGMNKLGQIILKFLLDTDPVM